MVLGSPFSLQDRYTVLIMLVGFGATITPHTIRYSSHICPFVYSVQPRANHGVLLLVRVE
jgi:hypothetical protein